MTLPSSSGHPRFLCGITAPLFTPCDSDLRLDLDGAAALVEWLADRRCVNTIFVRSGMGRMFSFTMDDVRSLATAVIDANRGRMGVLVGAAGEWLDKDTGGRVDRSRYTEQAMELTRFADEVGADAAVHVMPSAIEPAAGETVEDAVLAYYRAVHGSADIPIVIYQPGGLPDAYRLTPALLGELLRLPRIAGAKISTTDDGMFSPLADAVRGSAFALICGHEGYYLKGLRQGAVGVIGQGCMAYPEILDGVQRGFASGDDVLAERAAADVWNALKVTDGLRSTVALKQVFQRKGVKVEPYDRGGGEPYDAATIDRVERELDALVAPYAVPPRG